MSFIDKALERAKALQKQKSGGEVPPEAEASSLRIPLTMRVAPAEGETVPQEINYHITRTVAVDPEVLRRHKLIVSGGEAEAAAAEGYKVLRTQILHRTKEQGHNTLLITGPLPGEGKTLTAINLAISIAREVNQTVLLVDADLRSPSVHSYFGLPARPGLVDHLTEGVPLTELLIHPRGLAKLVVLPGGRPAARAAELINSPLMKDLVQDLKHFYPNRYVLFDLPPLLAYTDALVFAPLVDAILLVVEAGKTSRDDIERSQELLRKFNLLGYVLNKAEPSPQGYYQYQYARTPKAAGKRKFKFPWVK